MIFLQLFWTFFKIGSFTIGGGYAMVPIIEEELVRKKKWIDSSEFVDILALSLGTVLPSFIIILLIAMFFKQFQDNEVVERIFKGIRPAVVALIAAPVFKLGKSARITRYNLWIPIAAALLIWLFGFSPIWVVLIAGAGGYLYGNIKRKRGAQ